MHSDDRSLLAVTWKGDVFLDTALPFGLHSAPKIFSAVADALLFIMMSNGVDSSIHYLSFCEQPGVLSLQPVLQQNGAGDAIVAL